MHAIITKFLGPTDRRGARVKATEAGGLRRNVTLAWDYGLGTAGNHRAAAYELACRLVEDGASSFAGAWVSGGMDEGYAFVLRDSLDAASSSFVAPARVGEAG